MNLKVLGAAGLAVGLSLVTRDSFAWLQFCNHTSNSIWVSYADDGIDDGLWDFGTDPCGPNQSRDRDVHVRGWFRADPGGCTTPNGGDNSDFDSWFYGENGLGNWWTSHPGGGTDINVDLNINNITWAAYDFCCTFPEWYNAQCTSGPNQPGTRTLWHGYSWDSADNFTWNLY
jgi:hypothetical protein